MLSDSCPDDRQNSHDNVFDGLHVGAEEASLVAGYLAAHDFSPHTCRAIKNDLRKFARWFSDANKEPFLIKRVTTRDVVDFRNHLHRDQRQAVASINRALVSIRRFFDWLVRKDRLETNPPSRSKSFAGSHLPPKVWIGLMCGGCFEKSNCGRTSGLGRSLASCSTAVAECQTW